MVVTYDILLLGYILIWFGTIHIGSIAGPSVLSVLHIAQHLNYWLSMKHGMDMAMDSCDAVILSYDTTMF